jgi:hypothetical protein
MAKELAAESAEVSPEIAEPTALVAASPPAREVAEATISVTLFWAATQPAAARMRMLESMLIEVLVDGVVKGRLVDWVPSE